MNCIKILFSIPKVVYFNFKYLPIYQALKLPIWISYNTKLSIKGKIILDTNEKLKVAMVRIGFHKVPSAVPRIC